MRSILHTVLLIGLLFSSATFAAPPSEPGDFRFAVYSDSAAELFWSRSVDSDGVVRGYEIRRNGELVTTIDALSYFTEDLTPGEINTFTITAVNFDDEQSSAASVTVLTGGDAPIEVGQPNQPTNLSVAIYGDTIAEIFWDRVTTEFLTYEISLDGVVVQTTSGTSHVFTNLSPGSAALVDVVAVNTDGLRSGAANILVTTSGNSVAIEPEVPSDDSPVEPIVIEDTAPEIRPQDLSIIVYSGSAAELFWTPNDIFPFGPRIFANEIRRDGVLIDTVDGESLRSYFDPNREPGISYTYTVTAISPAGQGSATITGPGFNNNPVTEPISEVTDIPAETIERLNTTFSLANGITVEKAVATLSRLSDRDFRDQSGFEFVGEEPIVEGEPLEDGFFLVFSCPDGGELLELQEPGFENDMGRFGSELIARDCTVGPITISMGGFGRGITDFEPGVSFNSTGSVFSGVNISDARDESNIVFRFLSLSPEPQFPSLFSYNSMSTSFTSESGSWSAASVDNEPTDNMTALPDGTFGTTIRAEEVTGIYDNAVPLETRGALEFANGREMGRPTAGSLFVGTGDNNLLIDFSSGDPDSFTLTETEDGTTISYTVPFDEIYRIDAITPADADIGF